MPAMVDLTVWVSMYGPGAFVGQGSAGSWKTVCETLPTHSCVCTTPWGRIARGSGFCSCLKAGCAVSVPRAAIAIAGGAGSGKTSTARRISAAFPDDVSLLPHDAYYRDNCRPGGLADRAARDPTQRAESQRRLTSAFLVC